MRRNVYPIIFSFYFLASPCWAHNRCVDLFIIREAKNVTPISTLFIKPLQSVLDAGPDVWVSVGSINTRANGFQRGFQVTTEAVMLLSEKASRKNSAVMRTGEQREKELAFLTPEYLNQSIKEFAKPFGIRGRTDYKLPIPRYAGALIGEGYISGGRVIAPDITDIGIFTPNTKMHKLSPVMTYKWLEQYFEFMHYIKQNGLQPSPGSRGDQFYQDMVLVKSLFDADFVSMLKRYESLEHGPERTSIQSFLSNLYDNTPSWMGPIQKTFDLYMNNEFTLPVN